MQARMDGVEGKDQEAYISELHKKKVCRMQQYSLVEKITPTMKNFIKTLIQTKDDQEFRVIFMQWMKLCLESISNKKLPELQMRYHSLSNDIQEQKIKKLNDILIKGTQNQLDEVEKELIATSFGLEHFMREIGQVYETIVERKGPLDNFNQYHLLPKFAADLLISGFPLEIMDGDACHMALIWVKAVFDSLITELGDKKVLVISVLGVQSSEKSTLLNTMFGLNFAVSAGTCTKGVHAQLIPVESNLIGELGYDYFLVLDTEVRGRVDLTRCKQYQRPAKHQRQRSLRNFSDGVVELAWYLPGGKEDYHFENMMAIANLRGNVKKHSKQFQSKGISEHSGIKIKSEVSNDVPIKNKAGVFCNERKIDQGYLCVKYIRIIFKT